MSGFNEAQQQALEKAYQALSEQFDGCLISVLANIDATDEAQAQEAVRVYYHGGRMQALGLCHEASNRLINHPADKTEP